MRSGISARDWPDQRRAFCHAQRRLRKPQRLAEGVRPGEDHPHGGCRARRRRSRPVHRRRRGAVQGGGPERQDRFHRQQRRRHQGPERRHLRHHRGKLGLLHPGPGDRPVQPGDHRRGLPDAAGHPGPVHPARVAGHGRHRPQGQADRRQRAEQHRHPADQFRARGVRDVASAGAFRAGELPPDGGGAEAACHRRGLAPRAVRQRGCGEHGPAGALRPRSGRDGELPGRMVRRDEGVGEEVPADDGGVPRRAQARPADRRHPPERR